MSVDPLLVELMSQTLLISNPPTYAVPTPTAPLDVYGRHANPLPDGEANNSEQAWENATSYKCRIEFQTRIFTDQQGRERKSSGRAYLPDFYPEISTESLVCVPSETQPALRYPVISYIDNNYDENGPYSTTIYFQ